MEKLLIIVGLILTLTTRLYAAQSVLFDSEGYACMGDDKSRKETIEKAFQDGKQRAAEQASTYIQSETQVKNAVLEKELISAYASAQVKVLQEILKEWYKDAEQGECFRIKLKVEVVPNEKEMTDLAKRKGNEMLDDPSAPLNVMLRTDRDRYRDGEMIRIFIRGNRPFFGRLVYKDASGALVQLLPNPFRKENYFNGGTVYELPSGEDQYELDVTPPFGVEKLTLYASTAPLGDLDLIPYGGVYRVQTKGNDISTATRGVKIAPKGSGNGRPSVSQFAEASKVLTTSAK